MYLYVGKVQVGPLSGYLWLLGRRLYLKLGWRPSDTYFLGNLTDPLSLAARLKRLIPRPVDVRRAAVQLAKALAAALYVARRCRDSPKWKIRTWEAEMMILDAASTLAWTWPTAHRALEERTQEAGRRGAGAGEEGEDVYEKAKDRRGGRGEGLPKARGFREES
jgi:hypothetical protein